MKASVCRALWKERVQQWRESGLSQRAYTVQRGWPVRQTEYWIRELRDDVVDWSSQGGRRQGSARKLLRGDYRHRYD